MDHRSPGAGGPPPRPALHIDADGGRHAAPGWESLTERLIREAQERGEFDDLPGHGHPLSRDDREVYAGEMALAYRILRNAGVAPPWIEADKEVRALLARRDALMRRAPDASLVARSRFRQDLAGIVGAHRAAVDRLNAEAPTSRRHRCHLVLEDELAALERAFDGDPVAVSPEA
jgi:hypothetical protein